MEKKTVINVIMLILIALGVVFLYKQISSMKRSEPVVATMGIGVTIPSIPKPAPKPVEAPAEVKVLSVAAQAETAIASPERLEPVPQVKKERLFWGNRGYLIKDGKSTFVKYSLLEQMKREYEGSAAASCLK